MHRGWRGRETAKEFIVVLQDTKDSTFRLQMVDLEY